LPTSRGVDPEGSWGSWSLKICRRGQSMFWLPKMPIFFHSKLLLDNSASFTSLRVKWTVKLISRCASALKQFDGLTWLTLTPIIYDRSTPLTAMSARRARWTRVCHVTPWCRRVSVSRSRCPTSPAGERAERLCHSLCGIVDSTKICRPSHDDCGTSGPSGQNHRSGPGGRPACRVAS